MTCRCSGGNTLQLKFDMRAIDGNKRDSDGKGAKKGAKKRRRRQQDASYLEVARPAKVCHRALHRGDD